MQIEPSNTFVVRLDDRQCDIENMHLSAHAEPDIFDVALLAIQTVDRRV